MAQRLWDIAAMAALAMLGFFLPFSSAGVAFAWAAILLLALAPPRRLWHEAPWRDPVMAVGLALFALIVVNTLYSSGWTPHARSSINEYQELLLAPVIYSVMGQARHRRAFIHALYAGAIFLAAVHWAAAIDPSYEYLVRERRISAGFVLSVTAFLMAAQARTLPRPWPLRLAATFLAATVISEVEARTGLVMLAMLIAYTAWLHAPGRWRWPLAVLAPVLAIAVALGAGALGSRVNETLGGHGKTADTQVTSTMIRIEMARVAVELAGRNLLTGVGYGNYAVAYGKVAAERDEPIDRQVTAHWMRGSNAHNEYLMQLIGGGIVACGLFVAWIVLALREASRAPHGQGAMLAGATAAFAVGCFFNSFLLDFVEGHYYVSVLAWLLAQTHAARNPKTESLERIAIILTRQIGDVLLATPLIHGARTRWPNARIEVIGFAGTLGMLRGNSQIDALIEMPAQLGLREARQWLGRLWRAHDFAFIADSGDRAHLIGWLAAPRRAGVLPQVHGSNWWKRGLLDHVVWAAGDLGTRHTAVEKRELLAPWLEASAPLKVVAPPANALPPSIESALQAGFVVVHAPSMWHYKQWPIAHFEVLVRGLLEMGRQVVLTGSASERDQQCIAPLRAIARSPHLLDTSGQLDFNQLVALFERAALYVGPDTSVSHLAAATGVPMIAIFGPTNPQRWAPWPAKAKAAAIFERSTLQQQAGNVTLLQSALPCVPCGKAGCEDHRNSRSDCLADIAPQRVLEAARQALSFVSRGDQITSPAPEPRPL